MNSGQVSVVRLDRTGGSGTVVAEITDPRFDTPSTIAASGNRLYAPNARFGTEPTRRPSTPRSPYLGVVDAGAR